MPPSFHMSPDEFRRHGHQLVEWVAQYMENVEQFPILSTVEPGQIRQQLPNAAPQSPEPFEQILQDLQQIVMPGITHWQSPNWFAFFPANVSAPSILAELISAGLGVQGMIWATSPACTELESTVTDWLVDLLALPQTWKSNSTGGGVIQMSASDATHTAMVVARHRATESGAPLDRLVCYASSQAHSSIEKGARVAALPHVRSIGVDSTYAMDPAALRRTIDQDLAAGLVPLIVTSAVGTTGTTAVDPLAEIGAISREYGLWHHVDAAYAGSAMICPEFRQHQPALELADSYVFNPHKWLFTNFDCSVFYVADRGPLLDAMSITPPYLRNRATDSGEVIDYRDWHVPLGRRFRALKLWFVIRSYGVSGLQYHIREHVRLARSFEERVRQDARFELVAPNPFALVCFRHLGGNAATDALAEALNGTGEVAVTRSLVDQQAYIRVAVGQTHTAERHVERLWRLIDRLAAPLS